MKLKSFKKLNLKNKKVLLRVNFDLPIKNGKILDDSRIKAHLPTIFHLIKKKAKVILISHLDNPQKIKSYQLRVKQYSLKPVFKNLKLKIKNLKFIDDYFGEKVKKEIEKLKGGEIILLENIRFDSGEEKNEKKLAKKLAELADLYINDAFPVCHRNHSSVSAITDYLPSYAGFLLEKEVKNLSEILEKPKHPLVILMGGAKISTKLPVIKNLLKLADKILIGGALANTFFKARELNIGQSLYEPNMVKEAKKLLKNKKIVIPSDDKIKCKKKNAKFKIQNLKIEELNKFKNFKILDIGQKTIEIFAHLLKSAKMIVWNGPLGYFEEKPFDEGTKKMIEVIIKNKKAKIFIGGGETIASIKLPITDYQLPKNIFISTGGGAMLEFLSGKTLPGLKPLIIKKK
ncbi:MAG: phosphoglycerate kinase [Patescibacteria group bacterium]|nr:phosphoglycerate kinase [Patescibacteria group bacterium]